MQHNKEPFPTVTVAVITYNHADFIVQCVQSILSQRGDFCLEILVFDDCSNDSTLDKLQEICDNNNLPENMSIQLLPSKTNLGMVKNLQRLIEACAAKNNEFTTIIDGDDFYFSDSRIQKNIDFLKVHPDIPMSFNALIMYNEEVQSWSVFIEQEKYAFDFLPAQLLAKNNIIGNIGCAFYRTKEIGNLPEGLFDIFTGDWFLHLSIANGRNIGFIHEPLSVYRINSNGIWKGKNDNSRYKILMQAIKSYDKLTRKKYHSSLMYYKSKLLNKAIPDSKKEHVDLLIMDDVFPHPLSGFRREEFHVLLNKFPNSAIALSGASVCALGKESLREIVRDYANLYPEHISKLSYCDGINMRPPENITASIAYFCFLSNAYYSLKYLEESKTPFIFELYPGGRFARYSETSDKMLREVTASPFFRKVITTQSITTKYLLENKFCTKDKIVEIFGVVTPKALLQPYCMPKKHYGFEKNSLDIVFSAFKYEKTGRDKGYDVFIELAHKIVEKYDNVYFHVVGGFDEKVLDVSALKNHIHFYGKRTQSWFDTFYQDKDIIISPNLPNVLAKGAFDGFPTAACTEAASREVAIFATDILSLNNDHFIPKKEIEIIPHNANEIMHLIEYYLHEPEKLKTLKQNGAKAVRRIYGFEKQMTPRIEVLRKELKWAKENKDAIKEISVEKKEEVESIEDFFTSTLYIMLSNGTVKKIGRKFLADVFNENEIIFNLPKLNSEINSFTWVITDPGSIVVEIHEVLADDINMSIVAHNGIELNGILYFPHEIPQIVCKSKDIEAFTARTLRLKADFKNVSTKPYSIFWQMKSSLDNLNLQHKELNEFELNTLNTEDALKNECGTLLSKLYLSALGGYTEQKTILARSKCIRENIWEAKFHVKDNELQGNSVRFDPTEGRRITCEILGATANDKPIVLKRCNGKGIGSMKRFDTTDPWFEFAKVPKESIVIRIMFKLLEQ